MVREMVNLISPMTKMPWVALGHDRFYEHVDACRVTEAKSQSFTSLTQP